MSIRPPRSKNQGGFTLIEVITALALGGLLLAVAGFGLVATVQGYFLAAENAAMSQKAQLALTRLSKEFLTCHNCNGPDGSIPLPFTYSSIISDNISNNRVVTQAGDTITINDDKLIDNVSALSLSRDSGRIKINLSLNHAQAGSTIEFETEVLPRNTFE